MKITKSRLKKLIKEELAEASERFTGGTVDIEPLGGAAQEVYSDAYYDLFSYLHTGPGQDLPGEKPSEKLKFALRWIAKFEQGA
jgi:hypothetical protein